MGTPVSLHLWTHRCSRMVRPSHLDRTSHRQGDVRRDVGALRPRRTSRTLLHAYLADRLSPRRARRRPQLDARRTYNSSSSPQRTPDTSESHSSSNFPPTPSSRRLSPARPSRPSTSTPPSTCPTFSRASSPAAARSPAVSSSMSPRLSRAAPGSSGAAVRTRPRSTPSSCVPVWARAP